MSVQLIIKIIAIILWLIEGFIMFERKEKLTKRDCFFLLAYSFGLYDVKRGDKNVRETT